MPGTILQPCSGDTRERPKLKLSLWVFAKEGRDPPRAYSKLSDIMAIALEEHLRTADDSESADDIGQDDEVCIQEAGEMS